MMRNMTVLCLLTLCALGFVSPANAAPADAKSDAKALYKKSKAEAEAAYKLEEKKCDGLKDNAKDVCEATANANRVHAEEAAEVTYSNTLSVRTSAAKKIAKADYKLEKAKCDAQVGNAKDVCVKQAKATEVAAIATATADKKVIDARSDEVESKKDAAYKVALEKCDASSGEMKDKCVSAAKLKYGK